MRQQGWGHQPGGVLGDKKSGRGPAVLSVVLDAVNSC